MFGGPVSKIKVSKIAGGFLEKLKLDSTLTKAQKMAIAAKDDDAGVKKAVRLAFEAKGKAKLSDEDMTKLLQMVLTST
ncbi:hypothetical protein P3T76_006321 [Phytophthora citrophthora]|uniref:Uncharacterized protein n=1 Tax=Phytophthora citrophthora TaxID=4793 RepID=A0AAD9GNC5_9STRA|nr:hypothetical protein P3T76_006321 [Phytophthora citrophthora]